MALPKLPPLDTPHFPPQNCHHAQSPPRPVILLAVQGGLGNQLFQYAFARRIALQIPQPIWIDQSRYHDPTRAQLRRLELLNLNTRIDRLLPADVCASPPAATGPFWFEGHAFERIEDCGQSPATLPPLAGNIALKGEWSGRIGYLYDPDFLTLLRAEFTAVPGPRSATFVQIEAMITAAANPVCVQVRRGEYQKLTHIFTRLGAEYYHAARQRISAAVPGASYFVFSDDPDQVRVELAPCRDLTILPALTPVESLTLSRLCRHFICANSTFSFWSALLAGADQVIVPRQYFTDPAAQADYLADPDFYPKSWVHV